MARPLSAFPPQKLLLVEGKDDVHAIGHLLARNGLTASELSRLEGSPKPDCIYLADAEGIKKLRERFKQELKNATSLQLGVVVDADEEPLGHWHSFRNLLIAAGYQDTPAALLPDGMICPPPESQPPGTIGPPFAMTVGVWVMPDNQNKGMLEDFAKTLVPPDDALWQRAVTVVNAIPNEEQRFSDFSFPKVYLNTWLAWQEETGAPIGLAIKNGWLLHNTESAQRFIGWVRRLFELPG